LFGEGFLFLGAGVFFALLNGGIHRGEEVDVAFLSGAFVVDGVLDGGSASDPLGAFFETDAIARFIAKRPHDDGRMVLDRVDHVGDAVEVGRGPGGIFRERFGAVSHAVDSMLASQMT